MSGKEQKHYVYIVKKKRKTTRNVGEDTQLSNAEPTAEVRTDAEENIQWKCVGFYGGYQIISNGNIRRLVDPETGRIIVQFAIPKREGCLNDGL